MSFALKSWLALIGILLLAETAVYAQENSASMKQTYRNTLRRIDNPRPLLADYPEFFEPIREQVHYEAPSIVMMRMLCSMFSCLAIFLQRSWHH